MSDEREEPLLTLLEPPPRGWERLLARRHAVDSAPWAVMAFASGACAAAVALLILDQLPTRPLTLPTSGARLLERPTTNPPLRLLDARAKPLPAAEGVQLYWAEPRDGAAR
jgi:hypothetical protein